MADKQIPREIIDAANNLAISGGNEGLRGIGLTDDTDLSYLSLSNDFDDEDNLLKFLNSEHKKQSVVPADEKDLNALSAYVDESSKLYIGKEFTLSQFKEWLAAQSIGAAPYNLVGVHHTWKPTGKDWRGVSSLNAIFKYYKDTLGWPEGKGPHIWIYGGDGPYSSDVKIYIGTHPRHDGIGISYRNHRALHIECIWNADEVPFSEKVKSAYREVIRTVCARRNGKVVFVKPGQDGPSTWLGCLYHREAGTNNKSCPGNLTTDEFKRYVMA